MKIQKKDLEKYIVLLVLITMICAISVYLLNSSYSNGVSLNIYDNSYDRELIEVDSGELFRQTFSLEPQIINGVYLTFVFADKTPGFDQVIVSIFDEETDELLGASVSNTGTFVMGVPVKFKFPNIVDYKGQTLRLDVQFDGVDFDGGLFINKVNAPNSDKYDSPVIDASIISIQKDIYTYLLVGILVMFFVLVVLVYYLSFIRKKETPIENIYLPAGIVLGIIFMLIIPVMSVPDEPAHAYTAYIVSDKILGIKEFGNNGVNMRVDDAEYPFEILDNKRPYVNGIYKDLFSGVKDDTIIDSGLYGGGDLKHIYFLTAVGITIGRLLGLGTILTYLIARAFNLTLFILAVYYSVKRMPFAKSLVAIWALLPVTLQQASSMSRDCPIFALSIIIISLTLHLAYDEKKNEHRIRKFIFLLTCVVILLPCKSFAYFPVCIFPLMLLFPYIKQILVKFKDKIGVKKFVPLISFATLGFFGLVFMVGIKALNIIRPGISVGEVIRLTVNTIRIQGDNYLFTLLGDHLGWLDVEMPKFFVVPFMFFLSFASLRKEGDKQPLFIYDKIWMAIIFAGVGFVTIIGMLAQWTPTGYFYIEGVQGRHFLPALVCLMLSLYCNSFTVKQNVQKGVLVGTVAWEIMVITGIVLSQM